MAREEIHRLYQKLAQIHQRTTALEVAERGGVAGKEPCLTHTHSWITLAQLAWELNELALDEAAYWSRLAGVDPAIFFGEPQGGQTPNLPVESEPSSC